MTTDARAEKIGVGQYTEEAARGPLRYHPLDSVEKAKGLKRVEKLAVLEFRDRIARTCGGRIIEGYLITQPPDGCPKSFLDILLVAKKNSERTWYRAYDAALEVFVKWEVYISVMLYSKDQAPVFLSAPNRKPRGAT